MPADYRGPATGAPRLTHTRPPSEGSHMLRARPVALSVTLIAALAAAALPSTALAKPVRTVTFDHPGVHTWQVPRGVRFATFDVFGAMGGSLPGIAFGGLGAHVR